MSFRSLVVGALALGILPVANLPVTKVLAQDAVQPPPVENSKYHFEGTVNSGSVYIRSGPGEGYYATQKLDKGAVVTVVGIKFEWLKIVPPDGSYSYVGSAFVDRQGDGKTGIINRDDVNIRAGSDLDAMKTTVQTRLNKGDTVEILGQEDEYLKIKPPEGAYLYVNKQFVDATRVLPDADATVSDSAADAVAQSPATQPDNSAPAPSPAVVTTVTPTAPPVSQVGPTIDATPPAMLVAATTQPMAAAPSTQPTVAGAPSTQPAVAAAPPPSAEELFGQFESTFADMSKQSLADQNIDDLTTKYQSIQNADGLSDNLKRVVDLRIATLKARADNKAKLLEARAMEKDAAEKELALQAEQQELAERLKQTDVEIYTAVGTLQPSSLQLGGGTLYRLTDPGTGRTVIYLRTTDDKATSMMGQFIGVRGTPTNDPQLSLRVLTPTDMETVDPAKVNGTVAAEIIPPSMLARQASASTGGN